MAYGLDRGRGAELQVVLPTPKDTVIFGFGLKFSLSVPSEDRYRVLASFRRIFGTVLATDDYREGMVATIGHAHVTQALIVFDSAYRHRVEPAVLHYSILPDATEPLLNHRIVPMLTLDEQRTITAAFFATLGRLLVDLDEEPW